MTEETRYNLVLGSVEEQYPTLDVAIKDLLDIFPEAFFNGDWKLTTTDTWMDVCVSCTDNTIIGKIYELEVN